MYKYRFVEMGIYKYILFLIYEQKVISDPMQETDTEIVGVVSLRDYNKQKRTGYIFIPADIYEKLGDMKDSELVFRFNKEKPEIWYPL